MLILHIFVILFIVGITVWCAFNRDEFKVRPVPAIIGFVAVLLYAIAIMPAFGQVPTGHMGVVLKFGGATGETKGEGLYVVTPFVDSVVIINTQKQAYQAKDVDAASKDLQSVRANVDLLYSLDKGRVVEIYRSFGQDYIGRLILPSIEEVMKANSAAYEAEKLVTERVKVKGGVDNDLANRLEPYGFNVEQVNITNFTFSKEFEQSIEAKVIADQLALKAENDLKRIGFEAQQRERTAQAEAEAIRLTGQALRDSPDLVALEMVKKWDGKFPQQMVTGGGSGMGMLFNMSPTAVTR